MATNARRTTLPNVTRPTLRELSGLPSQPAALADSTLVLIDCQNTYTQGVMELEGVEAALDEAAALLDRARSAGIPIVHVQHTDGPGSLYDIDGESGAIVARVAPREGEPVVVKQYPNSFVQTDLDDRLKAVAASNLVLAGFMTHMCVNSTARGAFNLGYAPTVVAAATATRSLPEANGVPVSAAAMQSASLAAMNDLFAIVVPDGSQIPG
jgi:nicotinamidase-related amidase